MEFTEETLKKIIVSGMFGETYSNIAMELNITLSELRICRLENPKLDDALKNYEYNAEAYFVDKMMEAAVSQKKNLIAEVYVEMYRYLTEKNGTF